MAASEAQINANRQNASKSTGPKTPEGKAQSRRNSFKHGLTGSGVVLPNEDVAEVERKFESYREELHPSGEVAEDLVRRAAILSVRLDRCVSFETASLRQRIRQADLDFIAPEGVDAETLAQLKAEARAIAMFDPSPEGNLARRYEASTERGYFRAMKELRQLARDFAPSRQASVDEQVQQTLASFFQWQKEDDEMDALFPELNPKPAMPAPNRLEKASAARADVPFAIGRSR